MLTPNPQYSALKFSGNAYEPLSSLCAMAWFSALGHPNNHPWRSTTTSVYTRSSDHWHSSGVTYVSNASPRSTQRSSPPETLGENPPYVSGVRALVAVPHLLQVRLCADGVDVVGKLAPLHVLAVHRSVGKGPERPGAAKIGVFFA